MGAQQGRPGQCVTCGARAMTGDAMAIPQRGMIALYCNSCLSRGKAQAHIASIEECAWCGAQVGLIANSPGTPTIGNWEKITGAKAIQLAERGNVARPGTFSAAAIKWTADGKAPFPVTIAGTVKCGNCGNSSNFSLDGLSSRIVCAGCGNMYSLFNSDRTIDGGDGHVIVASVYSARPGTGSILPELDIRDVANNNTPAANKKTASPLVLEMSDCGDPNKVETFVDAGGDINARDEDQWTLLHRAAFMDAAEYVRNLLAFGADPNLPVLPGSPKRTVEVVRSNGKPNASQIAAMLTSGGTRPLKPGPSRRGGSTGRESGTPSKRWWEIWK
jgi:hypothetical protein